MERRRSVHEVGPRLRKLREEAPELRGSPTVEGSFFVRPRSAAQRERDASDDGDWVVREALTSAAYLLCSAEDYLASIGQLLAESFPISSLHALGRGVLDACAHARWLVDPDASPEERTTRVYAWAIHSQDEERKLANSVDNRRANKLPEAGSVAHTAEVRLEELKERRKRLGIAPMEKPAATFLVGKLWAHDEWLGESLYRMHSGVLHGLPYSVKVLADSSTTFGTGRGVVHVALTRDDNSDAFLLAGLLTGYSLAARGFMAFTGQWEPPARPASSPSLWTPAPRPMPVHKWARLIESAALLVRPWLDDVRAA